MAGLLVINNLSVKLLLDGTPRDGVADGVDVLGREFVEMIPEVLAVQLVLVEVGIKVERGRVDPFLDIPPDFEYRFRSKMNVNSAPK